MISLILYHNKNHDFILEPVRYNLWIKRIKLHLLYGSAKNLKYIHL